MTQDEIKNIYKTDNNKNDKENNTNKETINNVSYMKNLLNFLMEIKVKYIILKEMIIV